MPKTDIDLPNRSGVVDPTIKSRELGQQFEASEAARRKVAAKPKSASMAGRLMAGVRAIRGSR